MRLDKVKQFARDNGQNIDGVLQAFEKQEALDVIHRLMARNFDHGTLTTADLQTLIDAQVAKERRQREERDAAAAALAEAEAKRDDP